VYLRDTTIVEFEDILIAVQASGQHDSPEAVEDMRPVKLASELSFRNSCSFPHKWHPPIRECTAVHGVLPRTAV